MKYLFFFFTIISFSQNQRFIPLDEETLEFISSVNYTLFLQNKPVYSNITSKDSITYLPKSIEFDSISFKKTNYKEFGLKKDELKEVIKVSKLIFELDEVVVTGLNKDVIIGEKSRFVKKSSCTLRKEPKFGLLFRAYELKDFSIDKLVFYIEKAKYKTTYKIKFYAAEEKGNLITYQELLLNEILFESPVLTLEKGTKNKVEVNLEQYDLKIVDKNVFVSIELQANYDEDNNEITLAVENKTRLKFQLSKLFNHYAKMGDSEKLININVMINHDFATHFFKKPHKSILVAPAILLNVTKN